MTKCREQSWLFQDLGNRKVEVDFGGGYLSSDGGGLILRELERHSGLLRDFAGCFVDYRDQCYIEHSVQELAVQRIASPRASFGPGGVVVARRVCRHRYRKKGRSRFLRRGWWSRPYYLSAVGLRGSLSLFNSTECEHQAKRATVR